MRTKHTLLLAAAAILGTSSAVVHASLVAYDGFNYTATPTNTVNNNSANPALNGGAGWSNSWSTSNPYPPSIQAGSLAYSSLTTSGNMLTVPYEAGESGIGAQRNLTTSATGYFSGDSLVGTRWISMLVQQNTAGDAGQMSISSSLPHGGITFGAVGKTNRYYGVDGVASTAPVVTGTTAFLVLEMQFPGNNANTFTPLTLYVDPTPGLTAPAAGTITASSSIVFEANGQINIYGVGWSFDELRFGTTYADVAPAPEPATLALLALGGLGILLRPRRRAAKGRNHDGTAPASRDEAVTM